MEGVGARFGRSSTRYGPATVFSGPVRKWKKRWIHVSPPPSSSSPPSATTSSNNNTNNNGTTSNGNNGLHLLLYKWTPLTYGNHKDAASSNSPSNSNPSNNNNNNNNKAVGNGNANPDETRARHQQPPKRKFKYIPVYLIEQQKQEAEENEEQLDDEAKLSDNDPRAVGSIPKNDGLDEKPNINDVPMEVNKDDDQVVRQDLNESTLDLSLGLKSHDGDSDSMAVQSRDGQ